LESLSDQASDLLEKPVRTEQNRLKWGQSCLVMKFREDFSPISFQHVHFVKAEFADFYKQTSDVFEIMKKMLNKWTKVKFLQFCRIQRNSSKSSVLMEMKTMEAWIKPSNQSTCIEMISDVWGSWLRVKQKLGVIGTVAYNCPGITDLCPGGLLETSVCWALDVQLIAKEMAIAGT